MKKTITFCCLFLLLSSTALFAAYRNAGRLMALASCAPGRADAVVVLGGDPDGRSVTGADLVRRGYASAALIISGRPGGKAEALFLAAGAKAHDIHFDGRPHNSYEEAEVGLEAMRKYGWKRVLVVSDPPHMLRVSWVWHHVLSGTGLEVIPVARTDWEWHPDHWRQDRKTREYVTLEYKKLGYYLLVYGLGIPAEWIDRFRS
ncbi:MAG: YdcF family protein [Nitrospiraceae bacterium]|nr:YdcF family protein [Nitrospiraceae bacterium]